MSSSLDKILANPRVWRGRSQTGQKAGLASGYAELDRHLPGGGWPPDSLTEILTAHYGIGELRILMPALAKLSSEAPEQDFYAFLAAVSARDDDRIVALAESLLQAQLPVEGLRDYLLLQALSVFDRSGRSDAAAAFLEQAGGLRSDTLYLRVLAADLLNR